MSNDETVKVINIEICSKLYSEWKVDKKWYKNVPKKGFKTDIKYIDTYPNAGPEVPIVLCLHGSPGSYEEFAPIRKDLAKYSLRFICPNFPTYELTERKKFGHFVEEKTQYILDFLRALNINKLGMIISHSSAVYVTMMLVNNEVAASLKSLVLLNPAGHKRFRAINNAALVQTTAFFCQYKFFRFFMKAFGKPVLLVTGCPVEFQDLNSLFLTVSTVAHSRFKKLPAQLEKLKDRDLTTLLIFSENDKLIQKEIFYDMSNLIGVDESNVTIYDKNTVKQESKLTSYPKAVVFRDGGHYSFLTHSKIVNQQIAKLVEDSLVNSGKPTKTKEATVDTGARVEVSSQELLQSEAAPTVLGSSD